MWKLQIQTLWTHEIMHKTLKELKYKYCNYNGDTDLTVKTSVQVSRLILSAERVPSVINTDFLDITPNMGCLALWRKTSYC